MASSSAHSLSTEPIRVSIIEDDRRFRETLEGVVNATSDLHCVSSHPNGEHALTHLPAAGPRVVLVDIKMPRLTGIQCVRELCALCPTLLPVMLTAYGDDELIFQSLKAGAVGYLLKRSTPTQIANAIREVHDGGSPMTPEIARRVALHFRQLRTPQQTTVDDLLTAREREVLKSVAEGKDSKSIGLALGIAVPTVNNHLRSIYSKLHVSSRTAAVARLNHG